MSSTEKRPRKSSKARAKTRKKVIAASKGPTWNFPKVSLEEAISVAQVISDVNAGKPTIARHIPQFLGYQPESSYFKDVLQSANQYGIVSGNKVTEPVSLTEIGFNIVTPTSPDQRQSALLQAFLNVEVFQRVAERYAGQRLPEFEFFRNTLVRDFGIPRGRTERFIEVFTGNLEYLKAFSVDTTGQPILSSLSTHQVVTNTAGEVTATSVITDTEGVREFLDTCFILMPFGTWFDRYFREIYVPATKDAGFEPLRADGLFNVGAVMEQIWTQIRKAKVLLADLTGKNPNVFYELGLAHALRKPVVFVAGDIEDVPFDVRHLRVVVYDIREPNWAEKLRSEITAYLKNTRVEPDKSIPQPYRELPPELSSEYSDIDSISSRKRRPHIKS